MLSYLLVIFGLAANAQACGGLLESNDGSLDIEPANLTCVWVLKLHNMTGISLELEQPILEPVFVISGENTSEESNKSVWTAGGNTTFHLNGSTVAIVAPPGSLKRTVTWTGKHAGDYRANSVVNYQSSPKGILEWEHSLDGTEQIFWVVEFESSGQLSWNLESVLPECGFENPCESISFNVFQVMIDGNVKEVEITCDGSTLGSLETETSRTVLILLHVNSPLAASSKLKVTWRSYDKVLIDKAEQTSKADTRIEVDTSTEKYTTNKEYIGKGILAGTAGGLFVIPFNGLNPFPISSKQVRGLAFDWSSKKVYWSEEIVGIIRADLVGNYREVLLEVNKVVWAIAIEPSTRNLYYSTDLNDLKVCNNDVQNCTTIIAGSSEKYHVYEFAFHLSKRLVFWSVNGEKVVRANLDGTNATKILQRRVAGLVVDETNDRLYWAFYSPKEIGNCDLNGQDVKLLPNIALNTSDIEFDDETIYFTEVNSTSIYRMTRPGTYLTLVANMTDEVHFINLFG